MLTQISQNHGLQHSPLQIRQISFDYSSDEYRVGSAERDSIDREYHNEFYNQSLQQVAYKENPLLINKGLPSTRKRMSQKSMVQQNNYDHIQQITDEFFNVSLQNKLNTKNAKSYQVQQKDFQTLHFVEQKQQEISISFQSDEDEIYHNNEQEFKIQNFSTFRKSVPNPNVQSQIMDGFEKNNLHKDKEHLPKHSKNISLTNQKVQKLKLNKDVLRSNNISPYVIKLNITQHHQDNKDSIQLDQTQVEANSLNQSNQVTLNNVISPIKSDQQSDKSKNNGRRRKSLKASQFKKDIVFINEQKSIKKSIDLSEQKESSPKSLHNQDQALQRVGSMSAAKHSQQQKRSKLMRIQSNDQDLTNQLIGQKKRRKQKLKDKNLVKLQGQEIQIKRVQSSFNETSLKIFGNLERVESNLSAVSLDSTGNRKSCLSNDFRKSLRKLSLTGNKVRFNKEVVGEFNELDEQAKIDENRKKYKKNFQSSQELMIVIQVQIRPKKVAIIRGSDQIFQVPYNKQYVQDKQQHKLFMLNIQQCKTITQQLKKEGIYGSKLKEYQQKLCKNRRLSNFNKQNKNLSDMKNEIKQRFKKTIVLHLEDTLLHIIIKKNELQGYDASAYVKLIGKSQLKLYLNYRPYLREMLNELRKDFELILFGIKDTQYIEQIGATLQKDDQIFDYLIPREMLYTHKDSGVQTLDLSILLGSRDIKDIIVVSHSLEKNIFHTANAIPVKEYTGCKKDLSFFALTRYLKTFRDVIDVRQKIAEDFYPNNN